MFKYLSLGPKPVPGNQKYASVYPIDANLN